MQISYKFFSLGDGVITSSVLVNPTGYLYVYNEDGDVEDIHEGVENIFRLDIEVSTQDVVLEIAKHLQMLGVSNYSVIDYLKLKENEEYLTSLNNQDSVRMSMRGNKDSVDCLVLVPNLDAYREVGVGSGYEKQNSDLIVVVRNLVDVKKSLKDLKIGSNALLGFVEIRGVI